MVTRKIFSILFFATLLVFGSFASAFPENVRHGYPNCTSCHVAPTGGGLITPYGRSLSSELMSTWSYKGEEGVLHGLLKEDALPEWLLLGGDYRGLQTWRSTKSVDEARYVNMQADLEAAVRYKNWTLDSTFGYVFGRRDLEDGWGSRRYFLMYNVNDEVTVRLGRFYAAYGLLVPDHYVPTRQGLGFDQNEETDNLEVAWNGENWNLFATAVKSPGERSVDARENAVALKLDRSFMDRYKVGISYWLGNRAASSRQMFGAHGILGFTKQLYLLTEWDGQWNDLQQAGYQRGLFTFNRLGYEWYKGLIVFAQAEYGQQDLNNGATVREAYGPGIQFFPRPHFEIMGLYQKTRARVSGSGFDDFAFILLHYYF